MKKKINFGPVFFNYYQSTAIFVNSDDCMGKISIISIGNNPILFETLNFAPMKMNFNVKTFDFLFS